jgi:hypothetical protein
MNGEKELLVCINKDSYYKDITYGKIYDAIWQEEIVYSSDGIYYEITNDLGLKKQYHSSKFIKLEEWREKKLKLVFGI